MPTIEDLNNAMIRDEQMRYVKIINETLANEIFEHLDTCAKDVTCVLAWEMKDANYTKTIKYSDPVIEMRKKVRGTLDHPESIR